VPLLRLLVPPLAALALLLAVLLLPASASARESQVTLFEAPRELLSDDAELRTRTLDEIQRFGVGWLRVIVYWQDAAPSPDARQVPDFDERDPAQYPGFGRYDRLLAEAQARGMRVLVTISGPVPVWATRHLTDHTTRPSPARFERFVTAVGRRYGGYVDHWAVWNEPNQPQFLLPQYLGQGSRRQPASPRLYRQLFRAADRGLDRAGQGRDTLLIGETSPRGTRSVVSPLRFLRGALCLSERWRRDPACDRLDADGWAHHAYTTSQGPFFRARNEPNDVTIGVLDRLNRALGRAERAGALPRGTDIWLTEFGIQSKPDPLGVSETRQAEYLAISERIAVRNPRVAAYSQYLMRDDDPRGAPDDEFGGFESGLRTAQGRQKLSYQAFPVPLAALRGATRIVLWGRVRPAGGPASVTIEFRDPGQRRWRVLKRDRTNRYGTWTTTTRLVRERRFRVRWSGPDGRRETGTTTRSYPG
jgi:hypothetical protein